MVKRKSKLAVVAKHCKGRKGQKFKACVRKGMRGKWKPVHW